MRKMLLARAVRLPSLLLVFSVKSNRRGATLIQERPFFSQEKIQFDNFAFCEFFVFTLPSLSSVFVARYCRYGFSVTRRLVWSTLNGLFGCIFDVGRVNIFCVSRVFHSAPGPFLLLSQGETVPWSCHWYQGLCGRVCGMQSWSMGIND